MPETVQRHLADDGDSGRVDQSATAARKSGPDHDVAVLIDDHRLAFIAVSVNCGPRDVAQWVVDHPDVEAGVARF